MKIAISAKGETLQDAVDLRFGRAKGFIIYDLETQDFEFADNIQNLEAAQGAGTQAAQNVLNYDVAALITGHCGPKAFRVLKEADVKIYLAEEMTTKKAIEKYTKNEIKETLTADVEGHWM